MNVIYSEQAIANLPDMLGKVFEAAIEWDEEVRALPPAEQQPALKMRIKLNDMVIGFFPDGTGNADLLIIKGQSIAQRISHTGIAEKCTCAGIICREPEEAEAMRLAFGDGKEGAAHDYRTPAHHDGYGQNPWRVRQDPTRTLPPRAHPLH